MLTTLSCAAAVGANPLSAKPLSTRTDTSVFMDTPVWGVQMIIALIWPVNESGYQLEAGWVQSARAVEARFPVRVVDALDAHLLSGTRRMHERTVAEIDADGRVGAVARVVEHEIAGLHIGALHRAAGVPLLLRAARNRDAPRALKHVRD